MLEYVLIGAILSIAANIATVIFIAYLAIRQVINWFRNRSAIKQADKDNIAFTLKNKLDDGDYETVQGVFNTRTNDLKDGRVIRSNNVDPEMNNKKDLLLYE